MDFQKPNESEVMKAVIPHYCPNCNQEIFVKIHSTIPTLASVLTREDIMRAKEEVLRELAAGGTADEVIKRVRIEIMDEAILFGPEDAHGIAEQYMKDV